MSVIVQAQVRDRIAADLWTPFSLSFQIVADVWYCGGSGLYERRVNTSTTRKKRWIILMLTAATLSDSNVDAASKYQWKSMLSSAQRPPRITPINHQILAIMVSPAPAALKLTFSSRPRNFAEQSVAQPVARQHRELVIRFRPQLM